jgi:hypothetical protein
MKKLIINRGLFCALALFFIAGVIPAQNVNAQKVTKGTIPAYLTQPPEIPYAGEVPLVPNVRPVIVLQGSDYEMGFQHTQQIIQIFGRYYLEGAAALKPGEKATAVIKKSEEYIKKYTPWAIEYIRGMADGCVAAGIPVTYFQMLAYFSGIGGSGDCSGWAAWGSATKDGKLICGGSGDHEIRVGSRSSYGFEVNVMFFPKTGNNFVYSPPSGGSGHPGMNNKGVVNVHHGTTGYMDRYLKPDKGSTGEGVPRTIHLMHCLRFANTAEEAKDIALSIPDPAQRQGGFWADVNGNALVIENKDNPTVIRRPGEHGEKDFLYSTNNLFSDKLMGAYDPLPAGHKLINYPHAGYMGSYGSIGSIGRNLSLWNLFHNYHGEVDLDFAKMMWRFQGPPLPYATIDEAVANEIKSQAMLWDAQISQPGNAMVGILQPDNGDNGIIHISHGCAVRGNDSPTYGGGVVVRLNPTFTFFELKLGSSPSDVCNAAQTRARYDLWNAYQELSKLDFTDVRYAELDRKLNEAVVEWQKGWFYRDEAASATGNEAVLKRAQAIRCYTRSQSYARQVYQTIIPPAKRPEDLNLRQWFGNWGEWTTRSSGVVIKEY